MSINESDKSDLLKLVLINEEVDKIDFWILTFVIFASSNIDDSAIIPCIFAKLKLDLIKIEFIIFVETKFTSEKSTLVKILSSIKDEGISAFTKVAFVKSEDFIVTFAIFTLLKFAPTKVELVIID